MLEIFFHFRFPRNFEQIKRNLDKVLSAYLWYQFCYWRTFVALQCIASDILQAAASEIRKNDCTCLPVCKWMISL